jgi:predicted transposase YbfD/YdcC
VLRVLPLAGRVVTAAALHTCAETARAILAHEADYLLVVKGNQPTLYAACAAYFSDPRARVGRCTTVDRRRGRTETRTLYVTTHLNAHLRRYSPFPRIRQVACLLTTTQDRHGTQREVRFLLSSLPPHQADPARLLALARGHWSIESRHWVRDVTFGEDRASLRCGAAPQLLAAMRNLTHTLIRRTGTTAIAATRRSFSYHPARALALLLAVP